jgi:hypothetical protein
MLGGNPENLVPLRTDQLSRILQMFHLSIS